MIPLTEEQKKHLVTEDEIKEKMQHLKKAPTFTRKVKTHTGYYQVNYKFRTKLTDWYTIKQRFGEVAMEIVGLGNYYRKPGQYLFSIDGEFGAVFTGKGADKVECEIVTITKKQYEGVKPPQK